MKSDVATLLRNSFERVETLLLLADLLEELRFADASVVRVMTEPREVVRLLLGVHLTPAEALALPLNAREKLDLVLRRHVLKEEWFGEIACDFAEHVLPRFEQASPYDFRPRTAIELSRQWRRGGVSDDELYLACHVTGESARFVRKHNPSAAWAANAAGAAADECGDAADAAYFAALSGGPSEVDWQAERLSEKVAEWAAAETNCSG